LLLPHIYDIVLSSAFIMHVIYLPKLNSAVIFTVIHLLFIIWIVDNIVVTIIVMVRACNRPGVRSLWVTWKPRGLE
jgi:ABC-type transport system involved in cytochrome bd biosynthesis fused ATPase/permease subunit